MRVVAVSGPQGAGKTTLLEGAKRAGWQVDDFKVSRAVQKEFGWDNLSRVMEHPETLIKFQNRILERYEENVEGLRERPGDDIILIERSYADLYAYTKLWVAYLWGDSGDPDGFVLDYITRLEKAQANLSGMAYLPFGDHIVFEHDVHRASADHVDRVQELLEIWKEKHQPPGVPFHTITARSVEDRVTSLNSFLSAL